MSSRIDSLLSHSAAIGRQAKDRINTPEIKQIHLSGAVNWNLDTNYITHLSGISLPLVCSSCIRSSEGREQYKWEWHMGVMWVGLTCGQRVSAAELRPIRTESPDTLRS
jgi:hypothetical protein